jgi:AcrR family transcriptional regulator
VSNGRNGTQATEEPRSKKWERAERILDAAVELMVRWGYSKTTIDDVAKQAGVAKGTIYLHWKTREELFQALIIREQVIAAEDIRQRIASDPEGGTLHSMMKHWALALLSRPIFKAIFLRDTEMLGELVRFKLEDTNYETYLKGFEGYLEILQKNGLLRTDLSLHQCLYLLGTIPMGFLIIDRYMPDDLKVSDEECAELMAETVRRTFEPQAPVASTTVKGASTFLQHLLEEIQLDKKKEREA